METVRASDFDGWLARGGRAIVAFVRESGCPACAAFAPTFDAYAAANPDVRCARYPLGAGPDEITRRYDVRRFPTVVSFDGGVVVRNVSGNLTPAQLVRSFEPTPEAAIDALSLVELKAHIFDATRAAQEAERTLAYARKRLANLEGQ